MKKLTFFMLLLAALLSVSLSLAKEEGFVSKSFGHIGINHYDMGEGGTDCSYLDDYIEGTWIKNYVNNYRGWAKLTCEIAVAVGGAILAKKVSGQSSSTSAFRRATLKEEAIEAAKVAAAELGCSVISKQSGWELIRVWDGTYYRINIEVTGHERPGGTCYATRKRIKEYGP